MIEDRMLECSDFAGVCCGSCHDYNEQGYDDLSGYKMPDGNMVWLCCSRDINRPINKADKK